MVPETIAIEGFLADGEGAGIAGLQVELWSVEPGASRALATGRSDDDGGFAFTVSTEALVDSDDDGLVELEIRVLRHGRVVVGERLAVGFFGPSELVELMVPPDPEGEADEDVMPTVHEVRGRIVGEVPEGCRVHARWGLLAGSMVEEHEVGQAAINDAGWFRLRVSPPVAGVRPSHTRLVIEVRGSDGVSLVESEPIVAPPARVELELELPDGPRPASEHAELQQLVAAELAGGMAALDGLDAAALDEVAEWLEVEPERLLLLQHTRALEARTGLPGGLYYALGRSGLPVEPEALADVPLAELRTTLEEAVADAIVGPELLEGLDATLERLASVAIDALLDGGTASPSVGLGGLLASADVPAPVLRDVLHRYQRRPAGAVELWESLIEGDAEHEALDEAVGQELRTAVELGALVHTDTQVLHRLHELRREGQWTALEDLARFGFDEWCELVEQADHAAGASEAPDVEADEDADEAYAAWVEGRAEELLERVAEAFPSASIRRELVAYEEVGEAARALLERAPQHDFVHGSIRRLVSTDASLLEDLPEAEAALEEIEAVERISRVTSRPEEVVTLVSTGMCSAHAIAATPRRHFVEAYGEALGGRAQASRVHADAQQTAAAALLGAVRLQQSLQSTPFVLGGGSDPARSAQDRALKEVPDARALFGSLGLCSCEHCGSVYSPAAYFVDLLRYLDVVDSKRLEKLKQTLTKRGVPTAQIEAIGRVRPLDALLERRPDLADIPLTCENTLTPLPYIDLVNELLEARVTGKSAAHDTGKTPADVLKAVPQHVDRAAYEQLQAAVHPLSLPFNEPLAVARAYLGHLGAPRLALMRALVRDDGDEAVLTEALGMSPEEFALVVRPPGEPWRHLGFSSAKDGERTYLEVLAHAPRFLEATGMSFEELIALVSMRFVNRDDALLLESTAPDCDPEKVRLTGLDEPRLQRLLRVVRLGRRLGWSFADLDRALVALGAGDLDAPVLAKLVEIRELAKRLERPVNELLGLWASLDTTGADNQFDRLLHTRAVAWRNRDVDAFALRPDRTELAATGDDLGPVAPALLAAFRITNEDLARIAGTYVRRGAPLRLDLAGISGVYRVATLAHALRLRLDQLDGLLRLVPPDADPFRAGDPAATRRFVDIVKLVQDTDFSPERLVYLFCPMANAPREPRPRRTQVDAVLAGIRRGLADAFTETAPPTEITPEALRSKLAMLLDAPLVEQAMEALDPRSKAAPEARQAFFERHLARVFPDPTAAAARLLGAAPTSTSVREEANTSFVLAHLMPHLRARHMRGTVVQALADALGTSNQAMAQLVEVVLRSRRVAGRPLLEDFYAMLGTGLTGAYFANSELRGEPALTRIDPTLELAWAGAPPIEGMSSAAFSVRWTGRILARSKAPHTFFVATDGAVKLSIEVGGTEVVVLEQPGARGRVQEHSSRPIELEADGLYRVTIEYRHAEGPASFALRWGQSPTAKQPIPTTHLFPAQGLASFEPIADGYLRVHKSSLLVTGFGMTDAQLRWLTTEPRVLDLDALPTEPGQGAETAVASFQRWRQLAALYALRKALPRSDVDLFEVLTASTLPVAIERLVQATGWDRLVVDALVGADGLAFGPADLRLPSEPHVEPGLLRLAQAIDVQRRVGVAVPTLLAWVRRPADADVAASIVQAVKARYDERRWLEVAQSLNDPLRIARREALVSYLVPRMRPLGVRRRSQLFEYFLIDVDMNPCMLSSRIKQGISAIQTFFQRILMNLEVRVPPRLVDEQDWKWLKSYRVWEANRKIFLYPENWIEPQLRDDKTPFFAELERSILQQEIKPENVEAAFIDYLQRLDEVARLDVRAVWFEPRGDAPLVRQGDDPRVPPRTKWDEGTYHVFGRTFNQPHLWFHRRLEHGRHWTPWERIDVDVEGDHLVPVMFQRRLHLFWAVFRRVTKKVQPKKGEPPGSLGEDWEIELSYSVLDRGKWQRKRIASRPVLDKLALVFADDMLNIETRPRVEGSAWLPPSAYTLRVAIDERRENLRIYLYCRRMDELGAKRITRKSTSPEPMLAPASLELVARFELDGCHGALTPVPLERRSTILVGGLRGRGRKKKGLRLPFGPLRLPFGSRKKARRVRAAASAPPAPLSAFAVDRGGQLPAPAGYRVDGTGYVPTRGGSLLALPTGPAGAMQAVLQAKRKQDLRGVRILPVVDAGAEATEPDRGPPPFFFQDRLRSYFVRPTSVYVGPRLAVVPVAQPLVGVHRAALTPRFGRRKRQAAAKSKSKARGRLSLRPGRRNRSREDAPEELLESTEALDPRALPSVEDLDAHADEEERAWHPDDAAERLVGRRRARKRPAARRPPAPAVRPVPPAPPPRFQLQAQAGRWEPRLRFTSFEHPAACRLVRTLQEGGIEQLLDLQTTRPARDGDRRRLFDQWVLQGPRRFQRDYRPGPLTQGTTLPSLDIDFDPSHPYAVYNWELFFHAPLQIAIRLAKDGRHEDAQRWFHYIFDPTADVSSPAPQRYWRFAPFHENKEYDGAKELMALLSYGGNDLELIERQRKVRAQVESWWEKPFNPHVIARMRIVAYQKATLMKYIDNLIEWGDKLFRRDTMETIQEATQLYVLAGNILGPRPERIPPLVEPRPVTFRQVRERLDPFANWPVRFENEQVRRPFRISAQPDVAAASSVLGMATLYFCIPNNPQLDKAWDTVADRLFKIRNCMNIQGVVRQLPLFEPPLDPALLVRAAAAGVDLGSVIANLNAPLPHQRFRVLLARALRMTEEVRSFGTATLAVLERKDAEGLAALRAGGERRLTEALREIRRLEIKQVETQQAELALQGQAIDAQLAAIAKFLAAPVSPQEQVVQGLRGAIKAVETVVEGIKMGAKVARAIPEFQTGGAGISSPFVTVQVGGQMVAGVAFAAAEGFMAMANGFSSAAEQATSQANIEERKRQVEIQKQQLELDKQQQLKKIVELDVRLEISNAELRRHDAAVDDAKAVERYMQDKFTNQELYGWMLSEISGVAFQAYKLAFDTAKLAERAYRFEHGDSAAQFVEFSYWDSLKKGLQAGERLLVDLRRMEAAHAEADRRALEVVRHVSLRDDLPAALQDLLAHGRCELEVTEALLDGDFPGHYFRRIKTVSVSMVGSIPPYANVNGTLTLLRNRIRTSPNASGGYSQTEDGDDPRFLVDLVPIQAIATSRPQADAGVLELKLDDDRYLPFEGAGAISSWRLELRQADNAVDLGALRNVVVTIAYTARSGGAPLEAAARASRDKGLGRGDLQPPPRLRVSLRHDLPEAWTRLERATPGQDLELELPLGPERLPGRYRGLEVRMERVAAHAHGRMRVAEGSLRVRLDPPKGQGESLAAWTAPQPDARMLRAQAELAGPIGPWKLTVGVANGRVPDVLDDLVLVFDLRVRKS